jgi:hypothetical protein
VSTETTPLCAETINRVERRLGTMTCAELLELETDARERMVEAQTDLMILQDYRERTYPDSCTNNQ